MTSKRALARVGARVAVGIVGIAVAVATIGAASILTLPTVTVRPPSHTVEPIPAAQQRVCPGPLLQLAADASASSASAIGAPTLALAPSGAALTTTSLKPVGINPPGPGPTVVTAPAAASATSAPPVAGAQIQTAAQDDVAGLAAAGCTEPSGDSWLAGGATTLGSTTLVLLSNPTPVQATVNLTVYAESGVIDGPGSQGIVVDPGTQRMVPLAGIAPNVQAPIVHVQATGGRIAAALQASVVQGLQPAGADLTGPTTAPAMRQVISGLIVAGAAAGAGGAPAQPPYVRVLIPGSAGGTVSVSATGENGAVAGTTARATVPGDTVQDLPLSLSSDGSYTVTVTSTKPVVAAARSSSAGASGVDFAWFAASPGLGRTASAAVASGPGSSLHLANPGTRTATVTVTSAGGATQSVTVPAGSGSAVPLSAGAFTLAGTSGIVASIGYAAPGKLASYPLEPAGVLAQPVTVYPR